MMKDKNIAAVLAFFLGSFGIHRFYLGQIYLGIVYCFLAMTGISAILGFIDAIILFSMPQEKFDGKYNWRELYKSASDRPREWQEQMEQRYDQRRKSQERDVVFEERRRQNEVRERERQMRAREEMMQQEERRVKMEELTKLKTEGVQKFKDFEYDEAIALFKKVLTIDKNDVPTHFNLACAYSLNEETQKAIYHLDRAVANGFNDFERIKTHEALAYVRIQDDFYAFAQNNFRLAAKDVPPEKEKEEIVIEQPLELASPQPHLLQSKPVDLLDQLQKLGDLKNKGILTEEEFQREKQKLLG